MNVIVANEKATELSNLDIDVIKSVTGQYSAEELVTMFKDFFFDRMIIDITSIKGYANVENIQKLAIGLGETKLILVLTDDVCRSASYLSNIISMGVYNFTNNINAIKQLIDNPNSYKDVAQIQQLSAGTMEPGMGAQNNMSNIKVLGIKNITDHAGATTLTYMIKNELAKLYGGVNSVYGIEIDRRDMAVFNDKNMISVHSSEVERKVRELSYAKAIIVDLGDMKDDSFCDEVLYLIEPSTIMLNRLIQKDRRVFERLMNKKIVLNMSMLSNKDVTEFEYEANVKVFYNLPPLDDRKSNGVIGDLVSRLGVTSESSSKEGNGIFGIFKK